MSASASAKASPAHVGSRATTIKPDYSYYHGKTINMVIPSAPGGAGDIDARAIAPIVGQYLHATVQVTDVTSGGTITGQDEVGDSAPNGLTVGTVNTLGDIENWVTGAPSINFALKDIGIIGLPPSTYSALVTRAGSGFTTYQAMLKSSTPVKFEILTTGAGTLQMEVMAKAYNMHVQWLTGFAHGANLSQGLLSKVGDAFFNAISNSEALLTASPAQAVPVLLNNALPKQLQQVNPGLYSMLKNVPTFASYFAAHKPKGAAAIKAMKEMIALSTTGSSVYFDAKGTPAKYTAALSAAFRFAQRNPQAIHTEELNGIFPTLWLSPAQIKAQINTALKGEELIKPYIATFG